MDNRQMEMLLSELLDCGTADLGVIGDTRYDWTDIIDYSKMNFGEVNLNLLAMSIVEMGKINLANDLEERINDLELEDELSNGEQEELDALNKLNPFEDIESFHNYIDTHVNIVRNEEIYRSYLEEKLTEFEKDTGFDI